jgi:hypothetical protein
MDSHKVYQFLESKRWYDTDRDSRFVNEGHPYAIIVAGEEGQVSLRENAGPDNGQKGEEIFSFNTLEELQVWFEDYIGE